MGIILLPPLALPCTCSGIPQTVILGRVPSEEGLRVGGDDAVDGEGCCRAPLGGIRRYLCALRAPLSMFCAIHWRHPSIFAALSAAAARLSRR